MNSEHNIGTYLAALLEQVGVEHYFAVPGDYNLVLLDQMLKNKNLQLISCCNELNAGYAADGYARARGMAAVVVTFTVGGLSLVNAVAGAYAEDLPIIVISGGPNSNDLQQHHILHHTLGGYDFEQSWRIFREITAEAVVISHLEDAHRLILQSFEAAFHKRKPVYIEVACNLASLPIPQSAMFTIPCQTQSNPAALEAAVNAVANKLNQAVKPSLVAGVKLRSTGTIDSFQNLAEACGYAVAVMPNAKSMFPENHPSYIGTYWGLVSSPGCAEIVESSDTYLFAGPIFNDYTTVGWSALIQPGKLIDIQPDRVRLENYEFTQVYIHEFLTALAPKLKRNEAALNAYKRIRVAPVEPKPLLKQAHLTTARLMAQIQQLLNEESAVLVETGDSWFNGQKLRLPEKARYEFQMQYGSIGWSVGATLGYTVGLGENWRVIALIGDGSFQLTAQEVSTMIRYKLNPIIFLINNGGYTIEVEIHDGPYNKIKNWNYAGLIEVFNAGVGNGWGVRVATEGELADAIEKAKAHDGLVLIECMIDQDDCSQELLEWGSRVAEANSRPPQT